MRAFGLEQRQRARDGDGEKVVEVGGGGDDGGQRRQSFELAYAAAGGLVQTSVDDRGGDERGRVDHEGRVLLGEDAWRLSVQGDHANQLAVGSDQRHGHNRLVLLFLELGEVLDARVLQCVLCDEHGLTVLGDPPRQTLAALHSHRADLVAVGIVGNRLQHEVFVRPLRDEDQRGVRARLLGDELGDRTKHLLEIHARRDRADDLVQNASLIDVSVSGSRDGGSPCVQVAHRTSAEWPVRTPKVCPQHHLDAVLSHDPERLAGMWRVDMSESSCREPAECVPGTLPRRPLPPTFSINPRTLGSPRTLGG